MAGAWTMTEEGQFILNEPYKTMLSEAKVRASRAWQAEIYMYLSENSPYTIEQIAESFSRRVHETGLQPIEIVNEFIIECLEGNL